MTYNCNRYPLYWGIEYFGNGMFYYEGRLVTQETVLELHFGMMDPYAFIQIISTPRRSVTSSAQNEDRYATLNRRRE